MRKYKNYLQVLTFFMVASFLLSSLVIAQIAVAKEATAQSSGKTASSGESASQEELAQILAPIALYPDTLLAQMFMAATYPLEIVEAARFVKEKSSLKDDALDKALKEKEWDVSVKSLCHFPTVLASLSEHLDATKRLGDYFLDDQKAVMDMVQTLRTKAMEEGNLKTTEEQKVTEEEKIIIIESANPQVVYVPSYSCTYVYGSWWYPHYPPYVWYPPPPRYGFGVGIVVGIGIGRWCSPNWRRGDINVNINRTNNFNKNVNLGGKGDRQSWKHNPKHRQGVAYDNKKTRENFGQSDRAAKKQNLDRGRTSQGIDKKSRDSIKKQDRSAGQRASKPATTNRQDLSSRQSSSKRTPNQGSSAFKSSNSGKRTNQMSQRGNSSSNRSRGGSRGGGGGRGGGGRR